MLKNKPKPRALNIVIVSLMFLVFLTTIIGASFNHISRDPYVMTNSAISIAVMSFECILIICLFFTGFNDLPSTHTFALLILTSFMSTSFSAFGYETYGIPSYSAFVYIMYTLAYITASLYFLVLWLYMKSMSYSDSKINVHDIFLIVFVSIYIVSVLFNTISKHFFIVQDGIIIYQNTNIALVFWATLYVMFFIRIIRSDFSLKEKFSLITYIILPSIVLLLGILYRSVGNDPMPESIADLCSVLSLYLIFFNMYNERGRLLLMKKNELTESRLNTMILQANPHFIYNTLGSIEYFCLKDPMMAKKMLGDFTKYLRSNSANLTQSPMIPFRDELENLKAYLRIEQVRFPKLKVEFDIGADDFLLPCLSVQPIVENSIKHGIGKRYGHSGTVTVRTEELSDCYKVIVIDDGIGFSDVPDDDRPHLGVENVRERLKLLCGGELNISSIIDRGTTAEITIHKQKG